jgi:ParB family transcriptional regulator, chromosome partitioning protein
MPLIKIDNINIGDRLRQDLGDVSSLSKSIKKLGLLHPIVVRKLLNGRYQLVAGERRISVAVDNNETEIEARIIDISENEISYAEIDENIIREDFTIADIARADEKMRERLEAEARERQKTGGVSETFAKGKTSAKIAALVGKATDSLKK